MFKELQQKIKERFNELYNNGNLFVVDAGEEMWDIYLDAFDEKDRQSNNCNCCRSFIKRVGGVVSLKDNKIQTLWGELTDVPKEYKKSVSELDKYVKSRDIKDVFYSVSKEVGAISTFDSKKMVSWNHFHLSIPDKFTRSGDQIPTILSGVRDNKNVLQRGIEEISGEAIDIVLDLIKQNSLYRGADYKYVITEFKKIKDQANNTDDLNNFIWSKITNLPASVAKIRNSSIGTLLLDISNGVEIDQAVNAFERMVAPANYKRPTSIITARQINETKKSLEEIGLVKALNRSQMSRSDLNVNNSLWVFRKQYKEVDIFDTLKENCTVNPKSLSKIEEVSIQDFIKNILPSAKKINVLLENKHFDNFVTLVKPEDGNILKWDNGISWSYTGQFADSIKERVKSAGGDVDVFARVSLSWYNGNDLDLHVIEPHGGKIYFNNRKSSKTGGELDVDMNAGFSQNSINPVENIRWKDKSYMSTGEYKVYVDEFARRTNDRLGCELEFELDGKLFNVTLSQQDIQNHKVIRFSYSKKDGFKIDLSEGEAKEYNSKEKWGVKSGTWIPLKALTLSPNYWEENGNGNKHFFFFLEGMKCDEKIRAFYNEMLNPALDKHRKVMEHLGKTIKVNLVDDELSGIGFSETLRNDLIVEVEGSFKRKLKIKF